MNKIILKISIPLIAVVTLLVPFFVFAQNTSTVNTKNNTSTEVSTWGCDGLQEQINQYGGGRVGELPKYCSEGDIYNKAIYWLYYILAIGAVIAIIYGGYMYMTASSNESQAKKGRNIIVYSIIGVAVAVLATAVVRIVINLTVDNKIF